MNLKSLITLIFCVASISLAHAEKNVLLKSDYEWNLYSQATFDRSRLDGTHGYLGGIKFGGILNDRFYVGIGATSLFSETETRSETIDPLDKYDLLYGGVHVGYVFNPEQLVHVVVDAMIGGGTIKVTPSDEDYIRPSITIIEPGLALKMNLTPTISLGARLSHREVKGASPSGISNAELSGLNTGVFVQFTQF